MLIAEANNLIPWAMLAIAVGGAYVVMRRVSASGGGEGGERPPGDERLDRREIGAAARIDRLEVRLHDFAHEVEAKLETRAAALEGLISAADVEIVRLTELIGASKEKLQRVPDLTRFATAEGSPSSVSEAERASHGASAARQEIIWHLHGAGYAVAEIAVIVGQSAETVEAALRAAA